MKTEKEDLGICVKCKKNKATITFTESSLHYSHGFTENICEKCYNKIQREHPLWKIAVDERNTEVKQAIEKHIERHSKIRIETEEEYLLQQQAIRTLKEFEKSKELGLEKKK